MKKTYYLLAIALLLVIGCATEPVEETEIIPVTDEVIEEEVEEEIVREDITEFVRDPFMNEDTGFIYFEAFDSSSSHLDDGFYGVRHDRRTSSTTDQMFVGSISEIPMEKTLQVSIFGIESVREDFVWECGGSSRISIRYGLPPTGNTQLLSKECLVEFEYNSNDDSYVGRFEGVFGDGLNVPSEDLTVRVQGLIAYKPIRR